MITQMMATIIEFINYDDDDDDIHTMVYTVCLCGREKKKSEYMMIMINVSNYGKMDKQNLLTFTNHFHDQIYRR